MRVDVVAAPQRFRRAPLLILLAIAVVPALGLFVLQRWLDEEADRYESALAAVEELNAAGSPVPGDTATPANQDTPVLDFRRLPSEVALRANAARLDDQVAPLFGFLNETSCAVVAVDGVPVSAHLGDLPVIPASTAKLFVGAVALEVLGADHVYRTAVHSSAPSDGVVDGDLYLLGGGDPVLASAAYLAGLDAADEPASTDFDLLADAVAAAGIERITGSVVGDGSRYDDEFVIEAWADGIAFVEAGPYDALMANDARVVGRRGPENDPNVAAAREFVRLLNDRGVRVDGGWDDGVLPPGLPEVAAVESPPLSEIVSSMLTASDDNTAELLVKEIGFADAGEGTRAAGLTAIDRTLRSWGIPMDGVRLLDGSGLDAQSTVTCEALVSLLHRSRGTAVQSGLPRAGRSGTLVDEFLDSPMAGRLYAKTGTLGNPPFDQPPLATKALAGYVSVGNGDTIEFALVVNAEVIPDDAYQALWAAFGSRFATYPAGPDSIDLAPR